MQVTSMTHVTVIEEFHGFVHSHVHFCSVLKTQSAAMNQVVLQGFPFHTK